MSFIIDAFFLINLAKKHWNRSLFGHKVLQRF
jgi:hypothetical protein